MTRLATAVGRIATAIGVHAIIAETLNPGVAWALALLPVACAGMWRWHVGP